MKRLLSILLVLALCLTCFVGCGKEDKESEKDATATTQKAKTLAEAAKYLKASHIDDAAETPIDYTLEGEVMGYQIEWSTDNADIKIARDGKWVKVSIPTGAEATELTVCDEIPYVLTATISDGKGKEEKVTFKRKIPAAIRGPQNLIVEKAYALAEGEVMEGTAILTGKITSIKTPYDPDFSNITVIIQIGDLSDKRIECYRMKGEGSAELAMGDTITVSGTLKNYNGTIEYDAGCALINVVPGERVQAPSDPKEIVDAAYALNEDGALPYAATLTGKITSIKTPYDSGYNNISVIIAIEGREDKPILCYRLKGEGAESLAVGDTISVNGYLINYRGTIEFTAGCKLQSVVSGNGGNTDSTTPSGSTAPSGSTGSTGTTAAKPTTPATKPTTTINPQESASIDFSDKANRVEYSTEKQVWKQNGITVTNEKGASTTNVGDYAKPGRFYKRSSVTIEYPGMTMIVIDSVTFDDNDYAAAWADLNDSNAQAVVIDGDVTIVFKKAVNSFTWPEMSSQGRAYKITVSTTKNPVLPEAPEQPDVPAVSDGKIVTNPKEGVAYKFGLNQTTKGAIYYFTGKMSGFYGATETDVSKAVDMYVEIVNGGYKLYFNDANGTKQYIKLVQSGTHYNFTFGAEASIFTWDAEKNAFHAPCGDQECYMGTYGTYVTVGTLTESKLKDTDYIARLYEG